MVAISEALEAATRYLQAGHWSDAERAYRQILAAQPDQPQALLNLGVLHRQQKKLAQAADCFGQLARLFPDDPLAWDFLAGVQAEQGLLGEAEASLRQLLRCVPDDDRVTRRLGTILQALGKFVEAGDCYQSVLEHKPDDLEALNGLGTVQMKRLKFAEAESCYLQALNVNSDFAPAHINLGALYVSLGRHDDALEHCRRGIAMMGHVSETYCNLGVALQGLGRLDEAIVQYRKAVEIEPRSAAQHGNLLYTLNYHPGYDPGTLFAEHRAWGVRHADPLTAECAPHANDRTSGRRLRVGYFSPHFHEHAVTFFSEPILASHDHEQFEIVCYAAGRQDEVALRLRAHADQWRDIANLSDRQAAELIRNDRIDILVDLAGHIGGNRLLVFAHKPAPIQVTYLGYQNTTGMLAMDYRLTDDYADPPGTTDAFYTEKLVRLPRSFFCYQPGQDAPPIDPLPALAAGHVTFGSFNHPAKVTPQVLETWIRLLRAVPTSRLILSGDMPDSLGRRLTETFASGGIRSERLELHNRLPHRDYLELVARADVALDPFPFNGHTTTCDSLWQGVPVVSLSGTTYVSRFGGSALATLGLTDLIARTPEQYVEIAAALAVDLDRLGQLRAALRPRMAASPLLDFVGFTRNLEAEYRRMWTAWCASEPSH